MTLFVGYLLIERHLVLCVDAQNVSQIVDVTKLLVQSVELLQIIVVYKSRL